MLLFTASFRRIGFHAGWHPQLYSVKAETNGLRFFKSWPIVGPHKLTHLRGCLKRDLHFGESNCHEKEAGGESLSSLIYWELLLSSFQGRLTISVSKSTNNKSRWNTWQSQRPFGPIQNAMEKNQQKRKNASFHAMVANGSGSMTTVIGWRIRTFWNITC